MSRFRSHRYSVCKPALLPLWGAALLAGCHEPSERAPLDGDEVAEPRASALHTSPAENRRSPRSDGRVARYVVLEGPSALGSVRGSGLTGAAKNARVAARAAELRAEHAELRDRVEAAGGTVVADLVLVANALQVRLPPAALTAIARLPGVRRLETPTVLRGSLAQAVPLVGATSVWQSASPFHGEGMRIGIIDTGIDYTHADFGGSGDVADFEDNDGDVVEPGSFPTAKVVGGKDLAGDDYDAFGQVGSPIPTPDDDPIDCFGHGTHVAGIAAGSGVQTDGTTYPGPYDVSLDPDALSIHPGSAPSASLFAIKIGGCGTPENAGETDLLLPAFELSADPDEDGDVSDRLDVVNLSLGYSFASSFHRDLEVEAVTALNEAGTLIVAAAGNDSTASFALAFPASAPEVLAVGATLKELVSAQFLGLTVNAPAGVAGVYPLGPPDPGTPGIADISPFTGQAVLAEPDLACEPITNGAELEGKVALIRRGVCPFSDKADNAEDVGAVAVLIVDNAYQDVPDGIGLHGALPTFRLRQPDGEALIAAAPLTVTLDAATLATVELGPDYLALFSSRGPTADAARLKPDLAAPGVDLISAAVGAGAGGVAFSGTSMSTPLTAGAAALLRQARPELGPLAVKELLTSTARAVQGPLNRFPATAAGAGRLQIDDALAATVTARVLGTEGDIGVAFGAIQASEPLTETRTVVISNEGASAASLDLALEPALEWPGMTVTVSPASVVVPAGGSETVELSLAIDPDALLPAPAYSPYTATVGNATLGAPVFVAAILFTETSGRLLLQDAGANTVAVVPYYGIARAAAERSVGAVSGCLGPGGATLALEGAPAAHDNATSILELGTTTSSFSDPGGPDASRDLVAVGALANPDDNHVYFGVATEGDWMTPARGFFSDVGIEVDTDLDGSADFLIVTESFDAPFPENPVAVFHHNGAYARVLDLATGELSQTFEPLNAADPAYPGGVFNGNEAYETQVYFNRVLVLPVELTALGLDATGGELAYRGVSAVSRLEAAVGLPLDPPLDTTDWVTIDASAPRLVLPDCFNGTPLCPEDSGSIALQIAEGEAPPTLLVLHHSNGEADRFETIELAEGDFEGNDVAIAAGATSPIGVGEDAVVTFTVTNDGNDDAVATTVALAAAGGAITSVEASGGSCTTTSCDLGSLAAGDTATVTVTASASAAGSLVVTATVASATACGTDASNDEADATFAVEGGNATTTASAGPTGTGSGGAGDGTGGGDAAEGTDDGCGCRTTSGQGRGGAAYGLGLMVSALALRRWRRLRSVG